MIRAHVLFVDRSWAVRVLGSTIAQATDSAAAEIRAADYLRERGGGELVLHYPDHRAPRVIRIPPSRT